MDLKRLADALTDYPFAYLITVDDDHHVHTVTVEPVLRGLPDGPDGPRAVIEVGLIGGRTRANLASHGDATLLWPPPEPGGYSLIVDGRAEVSYAGTETAQCAVLPTKALLHRNADSAATASGCLHDCVVFSEPS
ncbi:hypothetical protein I551_2257 [Mycobacterium ulcerans str. Harvey]|uniref:Pyridoxamine 5'-phosphate oxidase family protein n=1 Tax=Mycobacterium ulcerans str. Harvey TaxID=1299332 RepID=A0ABN0R258_MYCUL|nr:hypothetical protein I551_2257 [Mycobacterium ulcerans str. Harvey]